MARRVSQNPDTGPQTIELPFFGIGTQRATSSSYDQRFVNVYFDPQINPINRDAMTRDIKYYMTKRPGLSQNTRPSGTTGVGRGCYYWKKTGHIYSVVGNKIYGGASGTTDLGVTLTTSTGRCGIDETRTGASTQYLGINDGVKLYLINAAESVSTITTNFPNPNTSDLVYFDTYFHVLDTSGNLWQCNPDDPTTWTVSSFVTAQMMNGVGVGLAKQVNYVLVFTDRHMQAFWDAANTSGSPFSNVEQAMSRIGCAAQSSIACSENILFWIGNQFGEGGTSVWMLEGTGNLSEIGTSPINRLLEREGQTNLPKAIGNVVRIGGKLFYVLSLIGANQTFVYDKELKVWTEWSDTSTNYWPIISIMQVGSQLFGQHTTNGWIYEISPTVYQDDSVNFTVLARFGRWDGGTAKRKFCNRIDIIGDRPASTATVSIQYSDDDYQNLSTARTYDISKVRNFSRAWGNFRRRAWQLSYAGNQPLRLERLEMEIELENG